MHIVKEQGEGEGESGGGELQPEGPVCAACGAAWEGKYHMHRDGFNEGPMVPICNACAAPPPDGPTVDELWDMILDRLVW
jgi:hypothetical protein